MRSSIRVHSIKTSKRVPYWDLFIMHICIGMGLCSREEVAGWIEGHDADSIEFWDRVVK